MESGFSQPPLTVPLPGDKYALVSYIEGSLGDFLLTLRQEIVPGCDLRSHISILPPRPLASTEADALAFIRGTARNLAAFEVTLGNVEVFEVSQVIFIEVRHGEAELRDKYDLFNQDGLRFQEQWKYHPHVTLAQELHNDVHGEALEICQARWGEYRGPRTFPVDSLTFVKYQNNCGWLDLAEFKLAMAGSRS